MRKITRRIIALLLVAVTAFSLALPGGALRYNGETGGGGSAGSTPIPFRRFAS